MKQLKLNQARVAVPLEKVTYGPSYGAPIVGSTALLGYELDPNKFFGCPVAGCPTDRLLAIFGSSLGFELGKPENGFDGCCDVWSVLFSSLVFNPELLLLIPVCD